MKTCPKCKQSKPLSEFNKARDRPDGHQTYCRLCRRVIDKDFYERNESRRERIRQTCAKARLAARDYVLNYLATHPCVDCGETDIVVLDFDHLGGKERHVTDMARAGFSIAAIQREIDKCEVRCANCHRRITAKRHGGWWRSKVFKGDE